MLACCLMSKTRPLSKITNSNNDGGFYRTESEKNRTKDTKTQLVFPLNFPSIPYLRRDKWLRESEKEARDAENVECSIRTRRGEGEGEVPWKYAFSKGNLPPWFLLKFNLVRFQRQYLERFSLATSRLCSADKMYEGWK